MATAPKAAPKVVPIEENVEISAAPKKSKKKLLLLGAILILLLGGGGAAWYIVGSSGGAPASEKPEPPKPPVYLPMDQFTVNLQPGDAGDQYLQIAFTLQVDSSEQVEMLKTYMPLIRSRLLMLLSSKKASEISTAEGKKKLQEEIVAQVKLPFTPQSAPAAVSGVFFTSFVIQ